MPIPPSERTFHQFSHPIDPYFRSRLLHWCRQFEPACFLDSCDFPQGWAAAPCMAAVGCRAAIKTSPGSAFSQLQDFHELHQDWLFGHICFDLKDELVPSKVQEGAEVLFPELYFFIPSILVLYHPDKISIGVMPGQEDPEQVFRQIGNFPPAESPRPARLPEIRNRLSRCDYLSQVERILRHIRHGDCYQLNFCQEFHASDCRLDPLGTYLRLPRAPFSGFYRVEGSWLLCASPERFLKKTGQEVLSQPMKGTLKRAKEPEEDERLRAVLKADPKERSENVMVVDLVRNDLSRTALPGSVRVRELFGIFSFPGIHQMVSTIESRVDPSLPFTRIIQSAFPMGSMTGAPKKRVLELIGQYEGVRRGLYSGSLGYITPEGDFELNVVIRSLLYSEPGACLSFSAGSAITHYSKPESEWDECLLKAEGMRRACELPG